MKSYKTRSGATQYKPTLGVDIEETDFEENLGWCLACGDLQDGCEPDARRYACESCDAPRVYGLAELALMGLIATDCDPPVLRTERTADE